VKKKKKKKRKGEKKEKKKKKTAGERNMQKTKNAMKVGRRGVVRGGGLVLLCGA